MNGNPNMRNQRQPVHGTNFQINGNWIKSTGITNETINWAKQFGENLASDERNGLKKLSTTQLRKFFNQLKRIQAIGFDENNKSDLYMLKAQLAYANGRDKKEGGNNKTKICYIVETLSAGIDFIETKEHFKNFVKVVEAIVAFHKAAGGD